MAYIEKLLKIPLEFIRVLFLINHRL